MKKYLIPEIEVKFFDVKDIITASLTSGGVDDSGTIAPGGGNIVVQSEETAIWSNN